MKNFAFFAIISVMIFGGMSFAADTVIFTTNETSIDTNVASAVANSAGYPIFIVSGNEIDFALNANLTNAGITKIIIIGGPAVVSQNLEDNIKTKGYDVVRLWGITRFDTAAAVSRYFWSEGASCAVLVEDNENEALDTKMQTYASSFAAQKNCTLIPISPDSVSAETLSMIKDLNISKVFFIGRQLRGQIHEQLKEFAVHEITGDDNKIGQDVENDIINSVPADQLKIVIVAAPKWNQIISAAAMPYRHTIVKIVDSVDNIPEIASFIKNMNITNIFVIGNQEIAASIKAKLLENGVNATQVSGHDPKGVALGLWKNQINEWEKIRSEWNIYRQKIKAKLKIRALAMLNETEQYINNESIAAEYINSTDDVSQINIGIANAKKMLSDIRAALSNEDYETALKIAEKAKNEIASRKWTFSAVKKRTAVANAAMIKNPMVGNDRDEHGCIGSAGYSWCEAKQKCLRIWEESC